MTQSSCFVTEVDLSLAPKMQKDLIQQGFTISSPQYTVFQAKKKGVSCTLYQSGKLTVQGKEKEAFITFYLEPEILGNLTYSYPELGIDQTPRIGVDEAGKGDVFGPLCIGALFADERDILNLVKMGVRDSKKMSDQVILKLSEKIRKDCQYSLIKIFPQKYNELYHQFHNLNTLLGWGHAKAIEGVLQKVSCSQVTIDKFAHESVVESALRKIGIKIELTQRHRGEEDVVVAAASILARAAFLEGLEKLSQQWGVNLPKGASSTVIKVGRQFVAQHGRDSLSSIAKMHFKTIQKILGHCF